MSDETGNEGPLGAEIDLEAWHAAEPPPGFAERVLREVVRAPEVRLAEARRSWRRPLAAGAAALALAAGLLLILRRPPSSGERIAAERVEVPIGGRAVLVLEPGAEVRWSGDDVVQARGDVFYRVEPGARFSVHTPAGDVEVKGTCFEVRVRPIGREEAEMQKRDVKAGAVGAAMSALAFVAVYEGKVAASRGAGHVDLRAGESAQLGPDGAVKTTASGEAAAREFERNAAAAEPEDPQDRANRNLVRQVGEYRSRLEAIVREKSDLETKLKKTEQSLAAAQDGGPVALKPEFDVTPDDWKEYAKDGTIKYQLPCIDPKGDGWTPTPDKLNALGLAPHDGVVLKDAYRRSSQRVWAAIKPLCAQAVGSEEVASRIGPGTCIHLVLDTESERDRAAAQKAREVVGEIRAGIRPPPGPNEPQNPVLKLFLATTAASKDLEHDLAQSFGPEEAHRLVFSGELCMGTSHFGSSSKKK